jgi:hypothetical protein
MCVCTFVCVCMCVCALVHTRLPALLGTGTACRPMGRGLLLTEVICDYLISTPDWHGVCNFIFWGGDGKYSFHTGRTL